jgi:hypothetical protein
MTLTSYQKTVLLTIVSQIPMMLLLVIFFKIPNLPLLYRIMAIITILLEAAIISELIGNIVQKVRPGKKGIIVRGVFERKLIPWDDISKIQQIMVSPMKNGALSCPTKLFVVRVKNTRVKLSANEWWMKYGVLQTRRKSASSLVKKYDAFVTGKLKGWSLLWAVSYKRPQDSHEIVEVDYVIFDDREKSILDDLKCHGGRITKEVPIIDVTYPLFVRKYGGVYAKERDSVWESVDEKGLAQLDEELKEKAKKAEE